MSQREGAGLTNGHCASLVEEFRDMGRVGS
jgi:hypothetical protein